MTFLSAGHVPSSRPDLFWAWVTLCLSSLVAIGYAVIAFNWYFQIKVASAQARGALRRLLLISLGCVVCGGVFYANDITWGYLRLCDLAVAALAVYTWTFVPRIRGLKLVDQRLAEIDELEKRAQRYREIAELLPHLVWTASSDGRIDFSNQRWLEYTGDTRPWLEVIHPDDRDRLIQWWRTALRTRQPATIEGRLGGAGGIYRTFLISATPIIQAGEVKWLGACADVEDQRLLAAERERQAKQKSFFLSALSHDLRTPLNAVTLHAELLRLSVNDEESLESATAITQNAAAASELIDRLLDFAKVGSMERNLLTRTSLPAVLQKIYQRFLPLAVKNGLYLRLESPDEFELQTDPYKLERIISNLIDNAIKYTRKGGVTLRALKGDNAIVVQVHDTGIGVPFEQASKLFDEFYQLNNDERDRRKGFGLGLAICRSLARQLGGEVTLASTSSEGSCFELSMGATACRPETCSSDDASHAAHFHAGQALPA